ncbi:MAG TPA: two-component regulator propeller domain-containing protein, partial [Steroidobacteraceae bacterium]|nr:two-component regulator propeller domain-containing protein [Steroidobacteraceae bacterium]
MKKITAWLLLMWCTLFGANSYAQTWPPLGRDPNFSHLMMEQGQTVGEVLAIVQDHNGFIWIGGRSGLARYDGYRFNIYTNNPRDPGSLSSNYVRDAFVDSQGELWVATQKGVVRYDRRFDNFVRCKYAEGSYAGKRSEVFYRIIEDSASNLWFIGFNGVGIYDRKTNQLHEQLIGSGLQKIDVNGMAEIGKDEYAITTASGLFYWNRHSGVLKQYTHDEKDIESLPTNS